MVFDVSLMSSTNLICLCVALSATAAYVYARSDTFPKKTGVPVLGTKAAKHSFELIDKVEISEHVKRFRFALPSFKFVLGLPIGKHITLSAMISNPLEEQGPTKYVARQYTPVTCDYTDAGYFDLVIKIYRKNEHPGYPEGGWMSQYLDALPMGSFVDVKGPNGRLQYLGKNRFQIGHSPSIQCRHVAMIAGGTGVTPMYQLIRYMTKMEKSPPGLSLVFGNQHPGDILLRPELENVPNLSLTLTVDRVDPGEKWSGFVGFVSAEMIRKAFPPPSTKGLLVFLCGPHPMIKSVESILVNDLGYPKSLIHTF